MSESHEDCTPQPELLSDEEKNEAIIDLHEQVHYYADTLQACEVQEKATAEGLILMAQRLAEGNKLGSRKKAMDSVTVSMSALGLALLLKDTVFDARGELEKAREEARIEEEFGSMMEALLGGDKAADEPES